MTVYILYSVEFFFIVHLAFTINSAREEFLIYGLSSVSIGESTFSVEGYNAVLPPKLRSIYDDSFLLTSNKRMSLVNAWSQDSVTLQEPIQASDVLVHR